MLAEARRQGTTRRPGARPLPAIRSISAGRGTSPRRRALKDVAHGYRFASAGRTAQGDRPVRRDRAVVPFTSVVTAAGGAGGFASNARDLARWAHALYGGEVLAPEYLQAMVDARRTAAATGPAIPYGYGVQAARDRRPAVGRAFRSAARLPIGGALPARPGHHDRGPDQPEPDRSGTDRPLAAATRAHPAATPPAAAPSAADRLLRRGRRYRSRPVRIGDLSCARRGRTVGLRLRCQHADPSRRLHRRGGRERRPRARGAPP